jgi:NADPH2:quinone reductase
VLRHLEGEQRISQDVLDHLALLAGEAKQYPVVVRGEQHEAARPDHRLDLRPGPFGVPVLSLLTRRKRLLIYSIQMLKRRKPGWFRQDLTTLFDLLGRGELKPVIDRKLRLEEAALAHALLVKGDTVGKIVLVSQ